MNVEGKTLLLTGASGGIGQALARVLDEQGANLILTARSLDELTQVKDCLKGTKHALFACDLNNASERSDLLRFAKQSSVDGLINLAGANEFSLLQDTPEESIDCLLSMNLMVPMLLSKSLAPYLQQKPESFIINVGSALGSIGYAGSSVYCASKFGLRGFTEAIRREYADTNLKVIFVAPRATDTSMNSSNAVALNEKLGNKSDSPETVANTIATAITREKLVNYIGWPEKFFVRLNALFPLLVDAALIKQLKVIREFAKRPFNQILRTEL